MGIYFEVRGAAYRHSEHDTPRLRAMSISYNCEDGVLLISGANGVGKTTLLSIIAGELSPTHGSITRSAHFVDNVMCIFQSTGLFRDLTVMQNLEASRMSADCIQAASEKYQLSSLLNHKAHTLSGGEDRRVQIARCTFSDKPLWLVDEATAALDEQTSLQFLDDCRQHIVGKRGGIVLVAHDRFWIDRLKNLLPVERFKEVLLR